MEGRILSCVGGLYSVVSNGEIYPCFAKGTFRHDNISPIAGDFVEFEIDKSEKKREYSGYIIKILDRKNSFIRPEVANIDVMFVVFAVTNPAPGFIAIDKLLSIAEHNGIEAVIIFNKADIDSGEGEALREIYEKCGYSVYLVSAKDSPDEIRKDLLQYTKGKTCVFAGPSGVGKSTMINTLYPDLLKVTTGDISIKNRRGKNTTRQTNLYNPTGDGESYIVDTPGFTLLDFERFDFMGKDDLVYSFREMADYVGSCKYTKCTHTKEEGCKILEAVEAGKVARTRHESYVELFGILNKKKSWQK